MNSSEGSRGAHVASVVITVIAGCWALAFFARSSLHRWEYPVLSAADPARVVFLMTEFDRHLALAEAGGEKLDYARSAYGPETEVWQQLIAEVKHTDFGRKLTLAEAEALDESLPRFLDAAAVVAAGWGREGALATVHEISKREHAPYLAKRVDELLHGQFGPDRARAATTARLSEALSLLRWTASLAALVAGVALWRLKRRQQLPRTRVARISLPLGAGLAVFVWVNTARALAHRAQVGMLAPGDAWMLPAHAVAAIVAWVLLGERTSGHRLVVPRTLRASCTRAALGPHLLVAALLLGGNLLFARAVTYGTWLLRFQQGLTEGAAELLLYGSPAAAISDALQTVVFAAVAEELVFRGALFGALVSRLGVHWSAALSALVFALWHGYGLIGSITLFVLGYSLARGYAWTGSLLPGLLAHAGLNLSGCLFDWIVRATSV